MFLVNVPVGLIAAALAPAILGAAATAGFGVLTRLPATGYSPILLIVMLIGPGTAGTAFGSVVIASRGMADADQGLVGGMVNTSGQIGAALVATAVAWHAAHRARARAA